MEENKYEKVIEKYSDKQLVCEQAILNEEEMERFINDIEIKVKQVLEEVNK